MNQCLFLVETRLSYEPSSYAEEKKTDETPSLTTFPAAEEPWPVDYVWPEVGRPKCLTCQ